MNFLEKLDVFTKAFSALVFKRKIPLIVSWHLTYRCNLRCKYCGFWENEIKELDTARIFSIIDELAACGNKLISFTGGEPSVRDDLPEIIEYCKSKGIFVSVNSNGVLAKGQIHKIRKADSIKLSLDGPARINDAVRGEGVHDRVIEAIGICKENGMDVNITTVISKWNILSIPYILKVASQYNVGVYFKPANQNSCGSDKKDISFELPERGEYKKVIDFLIESKIKGNRLIRNSVSGLRHLYRWPEPARISCLMGLISCYIDPEGKVSICDMFPHAEKYLVPVKNGFKKTFRDLYLPYQCNQCWCPSYLEVNLLKSLKLRGIVDMYRSLNKTQEVKREADEAKKVKK